MAAIGEHPIAGGDQAVPADSSWGHAPCHVLVGLEPCDQAHAGGLKKRHGLKKMRGHVLDDLERLKGIQLVSQYSFLNF